MSEQPDHLSESELRKLFSESGYFETLDDAVIREIGDASEVVHVRGGDRVVRGVGGGVAEIVGKKLRLLGRDRQVLCVTHLPQVASQAHHHFRVEKTSKADDTSTDVVVLNRDERLEEIARMLGGMTITEQTRAHANEMIAGQV